MNKIFFVQFIIAEWVQWDYYDSAVIIAPNLDEAKLFGGQLIGTNPMDYIFSNYCECGESNDVYPAGVLCA